MSTNSTQAGDYCWCPRSFVLGGYWNAGSMAGLFTLDPRIGATSRVQFPAIRLAGILPRTKPTYPAFIPRRWIYLSEHAKKARTRKKWKHAIERKIELYKKRNKGAIA